MKLRNKKTGETGYYLHTHRDHNTGVLKVAVLKDGVSFSEFKPHEPIYDYDSLAGINEDWEDYTLAEPLIKDDKIRQTIKTWADVNEITSVFITVIKDAEEGYLYWELAGVEWEQSISICFGGELPDTLEDLRVYTIEELCGSPSDEEGK